MIYKTEEMGQVKMQSVSSPGVIIGLYCELFNEALRSSLPDDISLVWEISRLISKMHGTTMQILKSMSTTLWFIHSSNRTYLMAYPWGSGKYQCSYHICMRPPCKETWVRLLLYYSTTPLQYSFVILWTGQAMMTPNFIKPDDLSMR